MTTGVKNRKIQRYDRFFMPQEMISMLIQIRMPRQHINYFGSRGFTVHRISDSTFRIHHHRWGSIANPETHVNEWSATALKKYFAQTYHYKNRSDNPQEEFVSILRERWFTKTDVEIVMAIYRHRVMTTSQLAQFNFYKSKSAARLIRQRCKQMADHHVLEVFQPAVDKIIGASENHYMLGEVGAYVVAKELNRPVKEILWTPRHNEIMMHTIYHTLEINNVFMAFRAASDEIHDRIRRECKSKDEFLLKSQHAFKVLRTETEYLISEKVEVAGENVRFNPDGLLILKKDEVVIPFFLEIDRDTMELHTFAEKVSRYEAYARSRKWEQTFDGVMPATLVVTTNEARMINLARSVRKKQTIKAIPWMFTTLDKVKGTPLDEIWISAQDVEDERMERYSVLSFFDQ